MALKKKDCVGLWLAGRDLGKLDGITLSYNELRWITGDYRELCMHHGLFSPLQQILVEHVVRVRDVLHVLKGPLYPPIQQVVAAQCSTE